MWETDDDFQTAKKIVENIKVVNDTAERGVQLIDEYNKKLSTNEEPKQYILQVVSEYRKKIPRLLKKNSCCRTRRLRRIMNHLYLCTLLTF